MKNLKIIWALCLISTLIAIACESLEAETEDGDLVIKAETSPIPLLPTDLPIYPTDLTLEGMAESVMDELEDWGVPSWLIDEDDVEDAVDELEDMLKEASLEILQPGVLSVSVENRVTEIIRQNVEVTEVGVNFTISNETDKFIPAPTEFILFLGDGELAEKWDESVSIPFADERVEDGQFVIKPGEEIELSIENVDHLVEMLNEAKTVGIGYKNLYRLADTKNGADLEALVDEFGWCVAYLSGYGEYVGADKSDCPKPEDLVGWHLTVKKLEFIITAESRIELPDIPSCSDFADEAGLDILGEACE